MFSRQNKSLCEIWASKPFGFTRSCGVFIESDLVLASAHGLENADYAFFYNEEGEVSKAVKNGVNIKSKELDIAIIELERPIGRSLSPVNNLGMGGLREEFQDKAFQGFVRTRVETFLPPFYDFNNLKVKIPPQFLNDHSPKGWTVILAEEPVIEGYSGSPIISKKTGEVVSVLTHSIPNEVFFKRGCDTKFSFFKKAHFGAAPHPDIFSQWILDVEQKIDRIIPSLNHSHT